MLGCSEGAYELPWLRADASRRLDLFDLTPSVIERAGESLMRERHGCAVRLVRADLNFVLLPPASYDVIWSSGCLHHITNLERLCEQAASALRPGGLFAFQDYVGERRLRYAPERLRLINAALDRVPARFRRSPGPVVPPPPVDVSPFCAVRSDELLPVVETYFHPVHLGFAGALFPLWLFVDMLALEREAPDAMRAMLEAEVRALGAPAVSAPGVYAVFRRR